MRLVQIILASLLLFNSFTLMASTAEEREALKSDALNFGRSHAAGENPKNGAIEKRNKRLIDARRAKGAEGTDADLGAFNDSSDLSDYTSGGLTAGGTITFKGSAKFDCSVDKKTHVGQLALIHSICEEPAKDQNLLVSYCDTSHDGNCDIENSNRWSSLIDLNEGASTIILLGKGTLKFTCSDTEGRMNECRYYVTYTENMQKTEEELKSDSESLRITRPASSTAEKFSEASASNTYTKELDQSVEMGDCFNNSVVTDESGGTKIQMCHDQERSIGWDTEKDCETKTICDPQVSGDITYEKECIASVTKVSGECDTAVPQGTCTYDSEINSYTTEIERQVEAAACHKRYEEVPKNCDVTYTPQIKSCSAMNQEGLNKSRISGFSIDNPSVADAFFTQGATGIFGADRSSQIRIGSKSITPTSALGANNNLLRERCPYKLPSKPSNSPQKDVRATFNIQKLGHIREFKLTKIRYDDWLQIKVNGHIVWAGGGAGKYGPPYSEVQMVELVTTAGRDCSIYDHGCEPTYTQWVRFKPGQTPPFISSLTGQYSGYIPENNLCDQKENTQLNLSLNLVNYLKEGQNTIDVRAIIGDKGEFDVTFKIKENCVDTSVKNDQCTAQGLGV